MHNGDHPISVTGYKHTTVNDFSDLEEDEDEDEVWAASVHRTAHCTTFVRTMRRGTGDEA